MGFVEWDSAGWVATAGVEEDSAWVVAAASGVDADVSEDTFPFVLPGSFGSDAAPEATAAAFLEERDCLGLLSFGASPESGGGAD